MPELIEVESYRRAAEVLVGRRIVEVEADDEWYLKGGIDPSTVRATVTGTTICGTGRRGKLLLLPTDGPVLGLRFGMTGRLLVDGTGPIDRLRYSSGRNNPAWDRFGLRFDGGGELRMRDPRRLGGVELDPDLDRLGPDAWTLSLAELRDALGASTAPLKSRLMDQSRLAGVGNLIVDETLWRAGLDPARPAGELSAAEQRRLHRHLRATIADLDAGGGSHAGRLQAARRRGSICPRDGEPLVRRTVGGRTTYSCPRHQR